MADVGTILAKVRALGADVVLESGKMIIVGSVHLNADQRAWLASNRAAIEGYLRDPDGGDGLLDADRPQTWSEFARILYAGCPESVDPFDWSWFVTTAGKIVRGEHEAETLQ